MKENQHNDNLERFFKASLENYAPMPSNDFWDRMETVIPPKPSFWQRWRPSAGQWGGLALAALVVVSVLWLWQQERVNVERLTKTVKQQQRQIEEFDQQKIEQEKAPVSPNTPQVDTKTIEKSNQAQPPIASQPSVPAMREPSFKFKTSSLPSFRKTENPILPGVKSELKNDFFASQNPENQSQSSILEENKSEVVAAGNAPTSESGTVHSGAILEAMQPIAALAMKNATVSSMAKQNALSLKRLSIRTERVYPRFSVEAGGTVFRLPLGRLFQQDTFLTGRTELSYDAGLSLNCELNNRTSLQVGYQFTNLRARRLALRYNTFPVSVQRRWAWGYRRYLEGKLGASLNSLVSGRTDSDGISVRGLKTTWVGLHGGVAANWLLSDKLSVVVGPTVGISLTPMSVGRRSWEVGMGASIRYQL